MYELKRYFEWHELIKLCHTRLYALAVTLHKCALILHKTIVEYAIACAQISSGEIKFFFPSIFQEFIRIVYAESCTRRVHSFFADVVVAFSFSLPLLFLFIFYLSHLLLWRFLRSSLKFSFWSATYELNLKREKCIHNSYSNTLYIFLVFTLFFHFFSSAFFRSFPHSVQLYANE